MAGGSILGYDLNNLYQKAFGVSAPVYTLDAQPNTVDELKFGKFGTMQYAYNHVNGGYYFMPVWFDYDGFSGGTYELPFPIVRLQSQKKIVETALTERKGAVVELINQESWKIYVKGFIVSKNQDYPEEEIFALKTIYEKNEPLIMRSVITDLFLNIDDKVIIKSLNFPEMKGIETVKPYEMELIVDSIFDLEYNPNNV